METIIKGFINEAVQQNKNIFDYIISKIESYVDSPVHNMIQLKDKQMDKQKKGALWESLCVLYIKNILNHDNVWLLKDVPNDIRQQFSLPKMDHGIDIISRDILGYYAIQCKYKKPKDKLQFVSWRNLSTFYAIVVKTGPWVKHVVMTNCNGCRHIGAKQEKDWSICQGTFKALDTFDWLKIAEKQGITTDTAIKELAPGPSDTLIPIKQTALTPEELRAKRLEKLDSK